MKQREFGRRFAQVVLESDVIFNYENNDVRGVVSGPLEQLEMEFDNSLSHPDRRMGAHSNTYHNINITMTNEDHSDRHTYYIAAERPINLLCRALHDVFPDIEFRTAPNTANNSIKGEDVLCERVQIKAASKRGNTLSDKDMSTYRDEARNVLVEVNSLINEINKTVGISEITSVILCSEQEGKGRTNPIQYKNKGAARIVYALCNGGAVIRKCLLKLRIGCDKEKIEGVEAPEAKIEYSGYSKTVFGHLTLESASRSTFMLKGKYKTDDGMDDISPAFNHEVIVSKRKRKDKDFTDTLLLVTPADRVEATVYPVQPYVCMAGIKARRLALVDLKVLNVHSV